MQKTFDYYRSTNGRLAASMDQEDNYEKYLRRIEDIVSKKPQPDFSTSQYMGFLNKCKEISRNHKSQEYLTQISTDNQILLEKIVNAKKRRADKPEDRYTVALHEKRYREQLKINEENRRIALRVIRQGSKLNLRTSDWSLNKESPRRVTEKTFY